MRGVTGASRNSLRTLGRRYSVRRIHTCNDVGAARAESPKSDEGSAYTPSNCFNLLGTHVCSYVVDLDQRSPNRSREGSSADGGGQGAAGQCGVADQVFVLPSSTRHSSPRVWNPRSTRDWSTCLIGS